jgi:hypothetical protein
MIVSNNNDRVLALASATSLVEAMLPSFTMISPISEPSESLFKNCGTATVVKLGKNTKLTPDIRAVHVYGRITLKNVVPHPTPKSLLALTKFVGICNIQTYKGANINGT